ncbi:MAG: peroxiredoxin [Chlamydiales bacterium]
MSYLAPAFCLHDQEKNQISLDQLKGKWVVLYTYPKDLTPGCTKEAIDFTAMREEFEKLGAVILGISPDSVDSHCRFVTKKKLRISLLSDPTKEILRAYGAYGTKKNFGIEYEGVIRRTFIINPKGEVVKTWKSVKVLGHVKTVLASLTKLVSDANV